MVPPMIYGSTSLAYSPLSPSPSALVHSSDGQYAVVTRDELHLLVRLLSPSDLMLIHFPSSFLLLSSLLSRADSQTTRTQEG